MDLQIRGINMINSLFIPSHNLPDSVAAFGSCISGLLQNMPQLQRLALGPTIQTELIRSMQPGLQSNRTLKNLDLSGCGLDNGGLHLIADALVGNTTMDVLSISYNSISSNGLDDITRLLESTQIKDIDFEYNNGVFDDDAATRRFAQVLSGNDIVQRLCLASLSSVAATTIFRALESNTVLEEMRVERFVDREKGTCQLIESLPLMKGLRRLKLRTRDMWFCFRQATFLPALCRNAVLEVFFGLERRPRDLEVAVNAVKNILARNRDMRRADLLLALQPRTCMPIASKSGIWYKAVAKMVGSGKGDSNGKDSRAVVISYPGASAVFKIFQKRTAILEKQLKRPSASTASQRRQPPRDNADHNGHNGNGSTRKSIEAELSDGQKRRRL